jgi:prevent-host-death family protein
MKVRFPEGLHYGPDGYVAGMSVATSRVEVGVRDLKNNLSRYLDRVRNGDEVTVTERGRPIARLVPLDAATDRLSELVAAGLVRAPVSERRDVPERVKASGTVSDLVAAQRR